MKFAVDQYASGNADSSDEPDESNEYDYLPPAIRKAFDTAAEWYGREQLRTNITDEHTISFYSAGQPGEIVVRSVRDDDPGDPPFGESSLDDARAAISIYVRRPLNDYTDLEEVFEFYVVEPSYDQAERSGVPGVKYCITRESRTGRPGVDSAEVSGFPMPVQLVPGDVRYRAKQTLDFVEWPSEVDNDADE